MCNKKVFLSTIFISGMTLMDPNITFAANGISSSGVASNNIYSQPRIHDSVMRSISRLTRNYDHNLKNNDIENINMNEFINNISIINDYKEKVKLRYTIVPALEYFAKVFRTNKFRGRFFGYFGTDVKSEYEKITKEINYDNKYEIKNDHINRYNSVNGLINKLEESVKAIEGDKDYKNSKYLMNKKAKIMDTILVLKVFKSKLFVEQNFIEVYIIRLGKSDTLKSEDVEDLLLKKPEDSEEKTEESNNNQQPEDAEDLLLEKPEDSEEKTEESNNNQQSEDVEDLSSVDSSDNSKLEANKVTDFDFMKNFSSFIVNGLKYEFDNRGVSISGSAEFSGNAFISGLKRISDVNDNTSLFIGGALGGNLDLDFAAAIIGSANYTDFIKASLSVGGGRGDSKYFVFLNNHYNINKYKLLSGKYAQLDFYANGGIGGGYSITDSKGKLLLNGNLGFVSNFEKFLLKSILVDPYIAFGGSFDDSLGLDGMLGSKVFYNGLMFGAEYKIIFNSDLSLKKHAISFQFSI